MSFYRAYDDVTLITLGDRVFRVATSSLPENGRLRSGSNKSTPPGPSAPVSFAPAPAPTPSAPLATVVNTKNIKNISEWLKQPGNVYIGRGMPATDRRPTIPASEWGNPFKIAADSSRELVIAQYEEYIRARLDVEPDVKDRLLALEGKTLACWCAPLACHGDVIVRLIAELKGEKTSSVVPSASEPPPAPPPLPTHFVCLPLSDDPNLTRRVTSLYSDIRSMNLKGFHDSLLVHPNRLHLTLAVCSLQSDIDVDRARKVLRGLASRVYDALLTRTLLVRLRGLGVMVGTGEAAHVVNVGVHEDGYVDGAGQMEGRAATVAAIVRSGLVEAGLDVLDDERDLKLHMTIFNTLYRQPPASSGGRTPIDARGLLKKHSGLDFGTVRVGSVTLCQMGADESGYTVVEKISLP
ncbi:hypothetical protein M427DRAFT_54140 [Gonapodya prolifera JEL478]|uniref:Uncharacterized protein n=1 Tax=Gonapodya prolifera (strain JEL478) TaxID=1344416 RepID=A0A139AMZ5_GONPJ|nr:hypothetical protein M427DRAFT_54140 [Gonapodya prolifera JEL478]|eukprot:KXS17893.1 hypothetical protein M427DRAFT_54140 [Gonapodya prolifera JEL478]